ncbi:glycoside hydrolase family 28 protein [Zasmidium cellare ATCC 36951]|uniref:Glycoside hydrolase family 28 protein n=1 Tax=Zasmidium cellare ATCC 36951 TaxID=1080233 RepID=A0A6A6C7E4_ZASCE|nr:glycoside hydrolase family 28 protein [Zasmidium cellare ATCC 36951]KAF2162971.1 glycoside hydrolase family 28 protein [Zasmidium cellare ATCC 36951]
MGFDDTRPPPWTRRRTCIVPSHNDPSRDDAPEILKPFRECRENSHIIFRNTTYHIFTTMNTTGLHNVDVELLGTLSWNNDNIAYWLSHSLPIGFQNQTSAWHFGGTYVHFYGHGAGTFNGNGQVWYAYANGTGNLHGRPHQITFTDSAEMVVEGLRFLKAQMWTTTVARSERVLLRDVYVNNSCEVGAGTFKGCNLNTDGCDTLYANNITFHRWTIDNGDDAIALKQNSTNIHISDSVFHNGQGIALGSIGQYPGQIGIMENFTARNIQAYHTTFGAYLKSWTGLSKGYPPNGGGGGYGVCRNVSFDGFTLVNVSMAWSVDQDQSYNGLEGGEDSSRFQFEDIQFNDAHGTLQGDRVVSFQCSGAAPCTGLSISNNGFTVSSNGSVPSRYLCDNVVDPQGFECTGPTNSTIN